MLERAGTLQRDGQPCTFGLATKGLPKPFLRTARPNRLVLVAMSDARAIDDWNWWWGAWRDRIRCGNCRALMDLKSPCPICSADYSKPGPDDFIVRDGIKVPSQILPGALDWSPYVMLQIMHRDWLRPVGAVDNEALPERTSPSRRVVVVLIFWTYFETLMSWYYETATSNLPISVASDLLSRYGTIGSRLDRLHRILFDTRYGDDLDKLGCSKIRAHLENLQTQRNAFVHGNPEAINDALVDETARLLPEFHAAWIRSFNLRCTFAPVPAPPAMAQARSAEAGQAS